MTLTSYTKHWESWAQTGQMIVGGGGGGGGGAAVRRMPQGSVQWLVMMMAEGVTSLI